MRAALYARVSSRDHQDPENQIAQLRELAAARGWQVEEIYVDRETGSGKRYRPEYTRMLADALKVRRQWDVLLFWSLDRFGREGTRRTLEDLTMLDRAGVGWVSLQEQYLDTLGPFKDAIIAVLAAVAKMERERISERVKAGLERARRKGRRLGRIPKQIPDEDLKELLARPELGLREIARRLGVSKSTIQSRAKSLPAREQDTSC